MNDAHHVGDIDRSVLVDVHGTGIQFIFPILNECDVVSELFAF